MECTPSRCTIIQAMVCSGPLQPKGLLSVEVFLVQSFLKNAVYGKKASLFAYKLRYLHTITLVPLVLLSSKPTLFDTIRQ